MLQKCTTSKLARRAKTQACAFQIEIQTQAEADFPERVFVYSYRLFDRYNRRVVSLAVLADDRTDWKPDRFGYSLWGFEIGVRFPIVKLLEYADQAEELASQTNPFAIVVLAHVRTLETRGKPDERRNVKLALVKNLYEHGWSGDDIRKLFRFIDWIMDLPEELKQSFWQEFHEYEERKHMPYITSVERIGMEKGRQEGRKETLVEAIAMDVELKFPDQTAEIMKRVQELDDVDALRAALKAIKTAKTADEFRAALGHASNAGKPS